MFTPNLDLLRCPLDPTHQARLERTDAALVCTKCRTTFAIKDGIPNLVAAEAQLPPGCSHPSQLPCRKPAQPQ